MSSTQFPRPRPQRVALTAMTLTTLLTLSGLAGCSADAPPVSSETTVSTFNQDLHDRLPADIRAAGVVRVGTEPSYAPASFFARDGRTIIGFEPDLAAAMAEVLGVRFEVVNIDFTEALPLVEAHDVDAVMSAMTDTPGRQDHADFVDYFSAGTAILVQQGNPLDISDLGDLCARW
jgi:polar amino acid transport system substrate-binding protein